MFTGIITALGSIVRAQPTAHGAGARLQIRVSGPGYEDVRLGESIALDGVCLTVIARRQRVFTVELSAETLARTTAGSWKKGDRVNLERALALGDRLGGHLVLGHVDGVGTIGAKEAAGEAVRVEIAAPRPLLPLIAEKGSVTVDGVSLTVNGVHGESFDLMLIPFTLRETTLGTKTPGARVNLEADVVARYVARLMAAAAGGAGRPGVTIETLKEHGYLT